MTPCDGWGGYTVDQLVRAALAYRADCSEEDDELLTILQREKPSELPLWLMLRLVGICQHVAGLRVPLYRSGGRYSPGRSRTASRRGRALNPVQHLAPQSVNKTFRNRGGSPSRSISGRTVPRMGLRIVRGRLSQRPRS
jgi:hypothetical protein